MPQPLVVPLVPGIVAAENYTIRITAISPTTGNLVSGVKVSATAILAMNVSDAAIPVDQAGPFTLLPGNTGA